MMCVYIMKYEIESRVVRKSSRYERSYIVIIATDNRYDSTVQNNGQFRSDGYPSLIATDSRCQLTDIFGDG